MECAWELHTTPVHMHRSENAEVHDFPVVTPEITGLDNEQTKVFKTSKVGTTT